MVMRRRPKWFLTAIRNFQKCALRRNAIVVEGVGHRRHGTTAGNGPLLSKGATLMAEKSENRPKQQRVPKRERLEPKPPTQSAPNPPPRDCADAPAPNPKAA
jgi:hypothetical protein